MFLENGSGCNPVLGYLPCRKKKGISTRCDRKIGGFDLCLEKRLDLLCSINCHENNMLPLPDFDTKKGAASCSLQPLAVSGGDEEI